ncbi:MAG TPA: hypothetical protein VKA67_11040, partial [Verrucomicrobiae bacterium]|nr:hypothetical protein [Verrucomicrobiae bacterium]
MKRDKPQLNAFLAGSCNSLMNTIGKAVRDVLFGSRLLTPILVAATTISTRAASLDLSHAKIFVANPQSRIETKAGEMLQDEIAKRTRISL